jgi:hypothetical protein
MWHIDGKINRIVIWFDCGQWLDCSGFHRSRLVIDVFRLDIVEVCEATRTSDRFVL